MNTPSSSNERPDIVLFGIQGSGKGTQARHLVEEHGFTTIEMGAIMRTLSHEQSERGDTVREYMSQGKLVPQDIIVDETRQRIQRIDPGNRILFDGLPRDLAQKEFLDQLLTENGRKAEGLVLEVPEEIVWERIRQRAAKEGRADDANEETVKRRLHTFWSKTQPAIDAFAEEGRLHRVDGTHAPKEVYAGILAALGLTQKKAAALLAR